ncbi:hypothetical protein PWT90_06887 [Aphanocladium album]|nr:hypothetical protein PWT90_06887 [Aphanocladium album]
MDEALNIDWVDQTLGNLGYTFRDRELIRLSITAAGADEANHDGNRRLALVGQAVVNLVVIHGGYQHLLPREGLNTMQSKFRSKAWCAAVADGTGISTCIRLCSKSGPPSKTVKRYAINAIIGAIWIDCEKYETVVGVLNNIHCRMSGTSSLSHDTEVLSSFNCQMNSALFGHPVGSPSQCLTDQGSAVSEQEEVILAEDDSHPHIQSEGGESGNTAMAFLVSNQRTDTTLSNAPILEDESMDYDSTIVTTVTAPHSLSLTSTLVPGVEWFKSYVAEDEVRCAEHHLPSPWLTPQAHAMLKELAKYSCPHQDICLKIWAGICSNSSVISLQEIMKTLKNGMVGPLCLRRDLSVNERLQAIDRAEIWTKGLLLVRRLHVLQLCKDLPVANERWISMNMSSDYSDNGRTKKPGNPRLVQESAVTKSLLNQIFPNLDSSSTQYRKLYEKLKKLRKLGQRLEMLASTFGIGILGLLPCIEFEAYGSSLAVSDTALLGPTDNNFSSFITLLDHAEGDMLRKFSGAAAPVVTSILAGELSHFDHDPPQQLPADEISKLPRCSEPLLACLAATLPAQFQSGSSSG